MSKNSEIDPKIRRKSDKIQDQVDPKWSQNEAKSDKKPKQPFQDAREANKTKKPGDRHPIWEGKTSQNPTKNRKNNIKNH